ncbi:MAG: hypothetical protein PUP92_35385 [Rhizonema sp. PD38]|nr:hypothetical protein [Rhizonema sp. PD38]
MNNFRRFVIQSGLPLTLLVGSFTSPAFAQPAQLETPMRVSVSQSPGIILNSGSTNTCPYTISVLQSGQATYTVCNRQGSGRISSKLTTKFFDEILALEPLSKLPHKSCPKSVSFGTRTEVKYKKQTSPDISCPSSNSRVTDLYNDAKAIQQELNFSTSKR